jgi:DNA-binding IclR family transcriptional regulator
MTKTSADRARSTSYWVPMVGSAIRILETFYGARAELSLAEVAALAKVGKTSAFRILFTLERLEYVEKNSSNGKYRLGLKLISAARKTLVGGDLVQVARPYLVELRSEFDETANLAALRKEEIIYLEICESTHPFRMVDTVGSRVPWHSTALGKCIAAFLPKDTVKAVLRESGMKRFTPHTIISSKKYLASLATVREQGYGIDVDETELGAACIAVPIFNYGKTVVGALSVSGSTHRIQERQNRIIVSLKKATATISKLTVPFEN